MPVPSSDFVMSIEEECLTAVAGSSTENVEKVAAVLAECLGEMSRSAPSLPGLAGFFNTYGRAYADINNHFELAAAECDSPYLVPLLVERQHRIAAQAVQHLKEKGKTLILANNNHNGLVEPRCHVWGSHENYLVDVHPSKFDQRILPFLATRLYAGCGALQFPSGDFLASARAARMEQDCGGATTGARAIHSLEREEHHMGPRPRQFRYHLIVGDGHRSQFNLALQLGATALTLKAIVFDKDLPGKLATLDHLKQNGSWVNTLHRYNVLASAGKFPHVDRAVVATQRIYLEAARRYADSLDYASDWIPRTLEDWQQTLDAFERGDFDWLSARLDMFIKYRFFSEILFRKNARWESLPGRPELFHELALLDHSYHEFCNPDSAFDRLDRAGLLKHRVGPKIAPGDEPEPWIPETKTRAQARARFICENVGRKEVVVDWSYALDLENDKRYFLFSPFAEAYTSRPPTGRPNLLP